MWSQKRRHGQRVPHQQGELGEVNRVLPVGAELGEVEDFDRVVGREFVAIIVFNLCKTEAE